MIGEIIFKGELGNVEPNVLNSNTLSKLIKWITLMYNYNVENFNWFAYKLEHCHNPSMLWFSQWIQGIDHCKILLLFLCFDLFFLFPSGLCQ
jgi:hypothetical protein